MTKGLDGEKDEKIQMLQAIAGFGPSGASFFGYAGKVAEMIPGGPDDLVLHAVRTLGKMGEVSQSHANVLIPLLDRSPRLKEAALQALGIMKSLAHADQVASHLTDAEAPVRAAACFSLGKMCATQKAGDVAKALKDSFPSVSRRACAALCNMGAAKNHVGDIAQLLKSPDRDARLAAMHCFIDHPDLALEKQAEVVGPLADHDSATRQACVELFAKLGDRAEPLVAGAAKHLDSQDPRYKCSAAAALGHAGQAAKGEAGKIAQLLDDTTEDRSQIALCAAGVETRSPAHLRVPACAGAMALAALGAEGHKHAPQVAQLLSAEHHDVRLSAATALGKMGAEGAKQAHKLDPLFTDRSPYVRAAAVVATGEFMKAMGDSATHWGKVETALQDRSPIVRCAGLRVIGLLEGKEMAEKLADALNDRIPSVQITSMNALHSCGLRGQMYAPAVCRLLQHHDANVRKAAIEALCHMGPRGHAFADEVSVLVTQDPIGELRVAAISALAEMGEDGKEHKEEVTRAKSDVLEAVRKAAEAAEAKM